MDTPRCYLHGSVVEISTSVREGLPLVCTPYMEALIKGCIAAAQERFPFTICHLMFLPNHFHLIGVVKNPADVCNFMMYLKAELSHSVNRLLGRTGSVFWEDGYFGAIILSAQKVYERMCYLYLNPVEATLVKSCKQYPGVSSFSALMSDGRKETWKKIPRHKIPELPPKRLTVAQQDELARMFKSGPGTEYELEIDPWAWLECFDQTKGKGHQEVKQRFLSDLSKLEAESIATAKRVATGAFELRHEDPRRSYKSERNGKRVFCLSDCEEQRKRFISWFQEQIQLARAAFKRWRAGDFSVLPPPGFFAPGGYLLANVVQWAVPM